LKHKVKYSKLGMRNFSPQR